VGSFCLVTLIAARYIHNRYIGQGSTIRNDYSVVGAMRSGRFSRDWYNQTVPVHVYDFKSIALPDELLALGRYLMQTVDDKTGDGPKPTILLAP
jgi:hypothetical protein